MLFVIRFYLIFICIVSRCFAGTSPRGTRKAVNRALTTGVRSLSFDSDDEDYMSQQGSVRSPPSTRIRGPFSDDEDEGHGASSSGTSSGASAQSFRYRQPNQFRLSDIESDDESNIGREQTSGVFDLFRRKMRYLHACTLAWFRFSIN
jgi:hypothetical protein